MRKTDHDECGTAQPDRDEPPRSSKRARTTQREPATQSKSSASKHPKLGACGSQKAPDLDENVPRHSAEECHVTTHSPSNCGSLPCPNSRHCANCIAAYVDGDLKPKEVRRGCCGDCHCPTEEETWEAEVLEPIHGDTAQEWRFNGYRAAYRYLYGVGSKGVRLTFPVCVLWSIRQWVKEEGPPQEEE